MGTCKGSAEVLVFQPKNDFSLVTVLSLKTQQERVVILGHQWSKLTYSTLCTRGKMILNESVFQQLWKIFGKLRLLNA